MAGYTKFTGALMNRNARAQLAQETVQILETGRYLGPTGGAVDVGDALRNSVAGTRTIRPRDWSQLIDSARLNQPSDRTGHIEVTSETTLAALERLAGTVTNENISALNFASAKHPGGGFLSGSQAQEESLARSSGLYATLMEQQEYYRANQSEGTLLYTDHAILSPAVPVFRFDTGGLRPAPFLVTFITMPAANLGAMSARSEERSRVEAVMRHRIDCVFALAIYSGSRQIVLGAWGCGVFRNEPDQVAKWFADSLSGTKTWRPYFDRIVFAVFDAKEPAINRPPFENRLLKL